MANITEIQSNDVLLEELLETPVERQVPQSSDSVRVVFAVDELPDYLLVNEEELFEHYCSN